MNISFPIPNGLEHFSVQLCSHSKRFQGSNLEAIQSLLRALYLLLPITTNNEILFNLIRLSVYAPSINLFSASLLSLPSLLITNSELLLEEVVVTGFLSKIFRFVSCSLFLLPITNKEFRTALYGGCSYRVLKQDFRLRLALTF